MTQGLDSQLMIEVIIRDRQKRIKMQSFEKGSISIGRDPGQDIVLMRGNISKQHAVIKLDGTQFTVADLGSTNGTYLNGKRIQKPNPLRPEDKIFIGEYVLGVSLCDAKDSAQGSATLLKKGDDEKLPMTPLSVAQTVRQDPNTLTPPPGYRPPGAAPSKGPQAHNRPSSFPKGPVRENSGAAHVALQEDSDWSDAGVASVPKTKQDGPAEDFDEWETCIRIAPKSLGTEQAMDANSSSTGAVVGSVDTGDGDSINVPRDSLNSAEACLMAYVQRDEGRSIEMVGKACDCGLCLLCQARRFL